MPFSWPGENLLLRLWETLAEKGVGGLLKPWQAKREAKAQIEARRLEIVALADAEKTADDIRSGRVNFADTPYALALPLPVAKESLGPSEKQLAPAISMISGVILSDTLRREVNVAKAITFAEAELKEDSQAVPDDTIEPDWLFRWRDYAGAVSSDELQSLWGRLLAGELKAPKSYSFRTLEFIRNLSINEAKKIETLSRFVIANFISRAQESLLKADGISFDDMLELQNLGVISGAESIGLEMNLSSRQNDTYLNVLCSNGRVLIITHPDPKHVLAIPVYLVTRLGLQIIGLARVEPHEEYLRAVGDELKRRGATVMIGTRQFVSKDSINWIDAQPI